MRLYCITEGMIRADWFSAGRSGILFDSMTRKGRIQATPISGDARQHVRHPPGTFERLLESESAFRSFLRRRVNDDAVAEDLLQQSLLRAVDTNIRCTTMRVSSPGSTACFATPSRTTIEPGPLKPERPMDFCRS